MALYLLSCYVLVSITWVFYLAIMRLKQERDTIGLTLPMKIVGYPAFVVGLALDVALNVFVASLLLLELPRELLTTARFKRWHGSATWRGKVVRWFCRHFLEPFDAGHCR